MSEKIHKLTKRIVSNKYSNEILSKNFNELAITEDSLDENKLKELYNKIFYIMPKKGKTLSHTDLIDQSYNYINQNYLKILEKQNKKLMTVWPQLCQHNYYF